jgi:hypothetical protein
MKRKHLLLTIAICGAGSVIAAATAFAGPRGIWPGGTPQFGTTINPDEPQPQFVAGVTKAPGGKQIGYVDLQVSDRTKRVVEVLTKTETLSLEQRAQRVADRMRETQSADATWWKQLSVGTVRGLWVVKTPKAPDGFLITADPRFAREWGISARKLAQVLMRSIHNTFEPQYAMRDAGDLRAQAAEARILGDNAYQADDKPGAEAGYKKSLQIAPSYIIPYLRLASLYAEQNLPEKARAILQEARQHHPDAESQQQISAILQNLRGK